MKRPAAMLATGWIAAVLLIAAGCALGSWQLRRMHLKQAMRAQVAEVLRVRAARPLASAADPARRLRYDWAAGAGVFLPRPAWLLDNQQRAGRVGVRVFRLFQPHGARVPLLIEMGWLPFAAGRQLPPIPPPPSGAVAVRGLLLPPPSPGLLAGAGTAGADGAQLVIALEPAKIAANAGLAAIAPRVLRLDPALPIGHVRDLDVLPNTLPPERHLGYAVQWFALAAAVFCIALLLTLRHFRRLRP